MIQRKTTRQAKRAARLPRARILRASGVLLLIAVGAWAAGPGSSETNAAAIERDPTPEHAETIDSLSPGLRSALERTGDVERGRDAYASCAVCHLADGRGRIDGTFPQLAGQHSTVIIKQLVDIREGRRINPLMLPFANRLSGSQEVADVALYVSQLEQASGNGKGAGAELTRGAAIYQLDCAGCHGEQGEGDAERFIPAIAGQHYGYMLRQIRDIGAGRRGNAHPAMVALAARYTDAELKALVDYASRMRDEETKP